MQKLIGQLPNFLRTKKLKTLTIQKGHKRWGGGNNDILIYIDMYQWREFIEEVGYSWACSHITWHRLEWIN